MKGTESIEMDIFKAIATSIEGEVSGSVYFEGDRPTDSMLEDVCIACSSVNAKQIQEGTAKVNIYVRDIDNGSGRLVKNKGRLLELEPLAGLIVSLLNDADTDYAWSLSPAPHTIRQEATQEHFLNINLFFKLINF
ncbi:MAG: hypothetical protein MJZ41_07555 [Bacteroidaceae bacterium]|nr:hypothetical protein [Bacteroidaceae bacterium]